MSIADEIAKLEELRQRSVITDAEFQRAKDSLLEGSRMDNPLPTGQAMSEQLALVEFQNELARLDREWELEREQYMVAGRYGRRYIPTKGTSMASGLMIGGFGIVWTIMAIGMAGFMSDFGGNGLFSIVPIVMPIFGVLFIAFGGYMSYHAYQKAAQHDQALEAYQRKRAAFISEYQNRKKPVPPSEGG